MPDIILEDPSTGNSWTITAPDEASARQAFEKHRAALKVPPDIQVQVRQPAAPEAAIQTNEQGNSDIAEPSQFPEMSEPGTPEPVDDSLFTVGPDEQGRQLLKDKSFWQKLGMGAEGLASSAVNQAAGFGLVGAAEPGIREGANKSAFNEVLKNSPLLQKIFGKDAGSFLFGDKTMDQRLEEGGHVVGNLPMTAAAIGGGALPSMALPESWLLRGGGAKGVAARTAAAPVDTMAINQADAALRGEDASLSEGTGTAMGLNLLGEALGVGTRSGSKKFRQRGMSDLAKSEEKMAPAVREWLKNVPYGPSAIPNADVRTQLGPDVVPVIRSEAGKAPRAFSELQRDAQVRREGELENAQATAERITGKPGLDTAAGQEQVYKEQRLGGDLSDQYTQALQTRMPNAIGYVARKTPDGVKKTKVIAPPAFMDVLTSSPRAADAWASAGAGENGGLARAEAKARSRGGAKAKPGQAEVVWHTIKVLEDGGQAEQDLARDLKTRLGRVNEPLGDLVSRTHELGDQERGAAIGSKVYTNPGNLDKKAHDLMSPATRQAASDAFVARFVEETSKGKLPKLTDQMRGAARELLGEQRASDLFRQYDIARRTREIDEPIANATAAISPEALTKPPGKMRQTLGAIARVAAASPGGIPAMLGAAGPAAARFLRDNPTALTGKDVEGLFSLLRRNAVPETKISVGEKARFPIGTSGATSITEEQRRKRRGDKHPVRAPNLVGD